MEPQTPAPIQKDKAGIIPWISFQGEVLMLFMIPSDPNFGGTQPQIAKGHIDPGMNAYQTAIKEGVEELGLRKSNVSYIHNPPVTLQVTGAMAQYRLVVYTAQVKEIGAFDEPHYETGNTFWLTNTQFQRYGEPRQKPLVSRAFQQIEAYLATKSKT